MAHDIRNDFPIFRSQEPPFVYLDNGATTQKPQAVIDRLIHYYTDENANIHRGNYPLSRRAEHAYDEARAHVCKWLDADDGYEAVFTGGSTQALNMAADLLFESRIAPGDNVVVTELEHSSNYFPWKHRCALGGVQFRVTPAEPDGSLRPESVLRLIDARTKVVAVTAMSNVTGYVPDLAPITQAAHNVGSILLADASQAVAHRKLHVSRDDWDMVCFSGHKVYGPMGIGVLCMKKEWLDALAPRTYGGGMIERGDGGHLTLKDGPERYEAGTQNIAGAVGLSAALAYLEQNDFDLLLAREAELAAYARQTLSRVAGIRLCGPVGEYPSPVLALESERFGAYDLGVLLARKGIAVRCGAHCAYPLLKRMGKESLCRVSLAVYNTAADIDALAEALRTLL